MAQKLIKNERMAKILCDIGELLELRGESKFKAIAYKKAANNIEFLTEDIEAVCNEGHLRNIPGVGNATEKLIIEYIRTGQVKYHKSLISEILPESRELLQISCISPKMNRLLYEKLKISNIEDLLSAAKMHQIQALIGFEAEIKVIKAIEEYRAKPMENINDRSNLEQELTQLCFSEKINRDEKLHSDLLLKLQLFLISKGYKTTREYPIEFNAVKRRDLKEYLRQGYIDLYAERIAKEFFYASQKEMQSIHPTKIAIEFDTGIRLKYKSFEKLIQSKAETCFGIVKGNNQYNDLLMRNKERFLEFKDRCDLSERNFYLVIIDNHIFYDFKSYRLIDPMLGKWVVNLQ